MLKNLLRRQSWRSLCSVADDIPEKTTVRILNEDKANLLVDSFDMNGFRLNSGVKAFGPIILFPKGLFGWVVRGSEDINRRSMCIFDVLKPKPEIVVIGYGESDQKFDFKIFLKLKNEMKLNFECLPTDKAVSTYNFMVAEGRLAAGAFIPPSYIDLKEKSNLPGDINLEDKLKSDIFNPMSAFISSQKDKK